MRDSCSFLSKAVKNCLKIFNLKMRCSVIILKVRDNSSPKMDFRCVLRCVHHPAPFLAKQVHLKYTKILIRCDDYLQFWESRTLKKLWEHWSFRTVIPYRCVYRCSKHVLHNWPEAIVYLISALSMLDVNAEFC